jgi:hypothetical protein
VCEPRSKISFKTARVSAIRARGGEYLSFIPEWDSDVSCGSPGAAPTKQGAAVKSDDSALRLVDDIRGN